MHEQIIVEWLAAHPFIRMELIAILAGMSAMAKADWASFQAYKVTEPLAGFNVKVAALQYLQGAIIGGVPPIVAKIWQILGA